MKRRFVFFWIGIGLLVLFAFLYLPGLSRYFELRQEEVRIERELAELEHQIQALKEEKELLEKDKEYLEKVIREELGLVRPGEMVYKLVPQEKKKKQVPSTPKASKTDSSRPTA